MRKVFPSSVPCPQAGAGRAHCSVLPDYMCARELEWPHDVTSRTPVGKRGMEGYLIDRIYTEQETHDFQLRPLS